MKKKFISIIAALVLCLLAMPALAAGYGYWAQVQDERGNAITTGVQYQVFTVDTKTLATIYADKVGTAKTNPVTKTVFATDGKIKFWCAATTVDLLVTDTSGNQTFIEDFGYASQHAVTLARDASTAKTLLVPFAATTAANKVNSGYTVPTNYAVEDVLVEVTTAQATKTMNVGLYGGDTDGFLAGISCDATGFPLPVVNTTTKYGAFLAAADQSGSRLRMAKAFKLGDTNEISYEPVQSGGSSASGFIHLLLRRLR